MASTLEQVADEFRQGLLSREQRVLNLISNAYRNAMREVDRQLESLTTEIEAAARRGDRVSTSMLWRERRLENLRNEMMRALAQAGGDAIDLVEDARFESVRTGMEAADRLVTTLLQDVPPRIGTHLASGVPNHSVISIVARTQKLAPLRTRLTALAGTSATKAADMLVTGIAMGQNPRKVAAAMRRELGISKVHAERIARTEMMGAHRDGALDRFRAEPMVEGWIWYAQTGSCCVACLAMHGSKHSLDERLDGHPNCRCVMLPIRVSLADLGYPDAPDIPTGDDLLASMIEGEELNRFGPGVRDALESGRAQLSDFVHQRSDDTWGTMRAQRPLRDVLQTT